MWAECRPGMTSTLASRSAGRTDTAREWTAPARHPGSFRRRIRNRPCADPGSSTASRIGALRRDASDRRTSSATAARRAARGRDARAARAAPIAMSASCSASGRKWISVSARKMVLPRMPSTSVRPNAMPPAAGVDRVADVVQADRGGAGEPGHHRVGVAGRDHAGGEDVAVLVDHALAVAVQEAAALQAVVQEFHVFGVGAGQPGVVDFDALDDAETEARHGRAARDPRARSAPACHSRRCGRPPRRAPPSPPRPRRTPRGAGWRARSP